MVGVLAVAALVAPANGSLPVGSTRPAPQYAPAGILALNTGNGGGSVGFDKNTDGVAEATQSLATGTNCAVKTDESLLKIDGYAGTSTTDVASFSSNSLGVAEKKTGTSCYQSNAPVERMVLSLNKTNVRSSLGPLVASSAYLDVELKQSARILATATLNNTEVARFELQSGSTIGLAPLPDVTAARVFTCNNPADSGPDAGALDNCRWPISAPSWLSADDGVYFDAIALEAKNGSFSVEGGADGDIPGPIPSQTVPTVYTNSSLVELSSVSDGDLACGDIASIQGTGTTPGVSVDRLDTNADPAQTCVKVPYKLSNGTDSAQFLKPMDQQSTAQFVITLTWTVPASRPLPLPVTKADYETPARGTEIALGWCPDPIYSGADLAGIRNPLSNPGVTDQDEVPGIQFTCIGNQRSLVLDGGTPGLADDTVQVTEQVYVLGDIYLRK
jgi:hypothetical protein